MRLLCALGLFLALLHVTSCLLIGAFNIQCFGRKKSGITDPKNKYEEARNTIKRIVQRYDIILIQEVRCNKDLSVPDKLLDLVNEDSPPHFRSISSEPLPLGPGGYKERYLFLYRFQTVTVKDSFQYEGKGFMRPPFFVKFSSTETQTDVKEFVLIPIHTKPGNAVQEIDALVDVVEKAKLKWTNNNIMVLGDFNADGTYVKDGDWKKIRLFTNKNFHWLIEDGVDTTVATSSNTYDRIVVTTDMNNGVVKDTARVFNFRDEYHLTQAQAKKVSDHFPVQVELEPREELGKRRALKSDVELEPKPYKKLKV